MTLEGGRISGRPGLEVLAGQLYNRIRHGEDPVVTLSDRLVASGMPDADAGNVAYRHFRSHVGREEHVFGTDNELRHLVRQKLAA